MRPLGRTTFGTGKVRKWKAGENDAAKREQLACSLYQIRVGIELRLVCKPVECTPCLSDRRRRKLFGIPDLDQDVHPGVGGNAAANQLSRNLPDLGVKRNPLHVPIPFPSCPF